STDYADSTDCKTATKRHRKHKRIHSAIRFAKVVAGLTTSSNFLLRLLCFFVAISYSYLCNRWTTFVALLLPQIIIRLIQPILPRWTEDIDVQCVFQGLSFMQNVRRDVQHFAGHHVDHLRFIGADPETQTALEDISYLFVLMRVTRHDATLLQINVRQHHSI